MKNHFWIDAKKFLPNSIVGRLSKTRQQQQQQQLHYPVPLITNIMKLIGVSKVIVNLLSPYLVTSTLVWIGIQVKRLFWQRKRATSSKRLILALFAFVTYLIRNMYRRYSYSTRAQAGLKTYGSRAQKIATLANLDKRVYQPHRLLWNADHLTIGPILLGKILPEIKFEKHILKAKVAVDVAHPKSSRGRVAFLLPGVGGNASATYVRATAASLLELGWTVVVINSRGLGEHAPHLNNPLSCVDVNTLVDDVRDVINTFFGTKYFDGGSTTEVYTHGVVVGFSLGALLTAKYFGREGKNVPQEICTGVSISGGFGMEFANFFRYRELYQPLIVPELVSKLFKKYV
jgi:hypothetical protein